MQGQGCQAVKTLAYMERHEGAGYLCRKAGAAFIALMVWKIACI